MPDRRLDASERVGPGLFAEVAGVVERFAGELPPVLGPGIRGLAEERLADERRRVGGAAQVRGVGVGAESDEGQPQGHLRSRLDHSDLSIRMMGSAVPSGIGASMGSHSSKPSA